MARKSTIKAMKAISALLFLAVAGLVVVGIDQMRHWDILTGWKLIGWALVPLAILLGFTWPTTCKVKKTNSRACGNWAYGFLFGCTKTARHWTGKLLVRLGLKGDEARPVESRKPKGSYALSYQPAPQSRPIRVTVEDTRLGTCASWAGIAAVLLAVVQTIIAVTVR